MHWSFEALEINQKNRSTKVANSLECDLNVADLQNCLVGFRAQKNANAGLDYATEEGISLHCESELEGSTQHSPYPSETKIYWCYLQLWHRLHTPSTSQTCIARVLGGLGIYYVKLLLIGLHMDRKQHFHEV